jgi:hypothetical protein
MSAPGQDPDAFLHEDVKKYREGIPEVLVESLFERVRADTVDRPPSVRDRLRELSTTTRVAVAVVALTLLGSMGTLGNLRTDLGGVGLLAIGLACLGMFGLAVAAVELALRGLDHSVSQRRWRAFLALSLGMPLALSLVPGWPGMDTSGSEWLHHAVGCGTAGLAVSVVASIVVVVLQRSERAPLWRVAAAAVAGGLVGSTTRMLSCPAADVWHMGASHGGLALATAILFVGGAALRQRLQP